MLMIDERFNATLILRFPTITNDRTTARMGTRLVYPDVSSMTLGVFGGDGGWVGGVLFWDGRFVSSQQQGRLFYSMAEAFLESIEHVFASWVACGGRGWSFV